MGNLFNKHKTSRVTEQDKAVLVINFLNTIMCYKFTNLVWQIRNLSIYYNIYYNNIYILI